MAQRITRCCTHCRQPGHTIVICREAYIDGMTLHNTIISIISINIQNPDNIDGILKEFLTRQPLHKLKLIANIHRDLSIFASNLYHNFLITLSQTAYRNKRDLLVVLGFYYKQIRIRYQQPLDMNVQLQQFQHAYTNRHFGDNNNNNNQILGTRKFTINTNIYCSNKEDKFECPICYDEVEDSKRVTTNCKHDVCVNCCDTYLTGVSQQHFKVPKCCMCRTPITNLSFTQEECCNTIKNKLII
jgi:hypothetical protein